MKALEEFCRLYCADHALNVVVKSTLSVKYHTLIERALQGTPVADSIVREVNGWVREVRALLPKGHKLTKFMKVSNMASQSHVLMLSAFSAHQKEVRASFFLNCINITSKSF